MTVKVILALALLGVVTAAHGAGIAEAERAAAKKIVEMAYVEARGFCGTYPASATAVRVKIDDRDVTIVVHCDAVNAHFAKEAR